MTSVFTWQNSVSLCPASFCTPRPNLPVPLLSMKFSRQEYWSGFQVPAPREDQFRPKGVTELVCVSIWKISGKTGIQTHLKPPGFQVKAGTTCPRQRHELSNPPFLLIAQLMKIYL